MTKGKGENGNSDAEARIPFEKLASSIAPDKEAWKADGNRFTPDELNHMSRGWSSAEIIEESSTEYRVN